MNDITPEELNQRLREGETLTILDVREEWEYEEHNLGGLLLPLNTLPDQLDRLKEYQVQELIVHCQSGKRSKQAKKFLLKNGFANVRSLQGGIEAFKNLL